MEGHMVFWLALALASAKEPKGITIIAVDAAGKPVPTAAIAFPAEREVHRVNETDGSWAGAELFPAGGPSLPMKVGDAITFWASGPGLAPVKTDHVLVGKKKDDRLTVTLQPLPTPALTCLPEGKALTPQDGAEIARYASAALDSAQGDDAHACLQAARAWGLAMEQQRALGLYFADRSEQATVAEYDARKAAIAAIRDWHDWAGAAGRDTAESEALCGSVRGWPGSCAD